MILLLVGLMAIQTATANSKHITIPYEPHDGQKLLHNRTERFRIAANPTSWGKDIFLANDCNRFCIKTFGYRLKHLDEFRNLNPLVHAWLVAPTYPALEQLWREVIKFLPDEIPWDVKENKSKKKITISYQGHECIINGKSADNPETLVAEGLDYLGIDEARFLKQESWYNLFSRLSRPQRLGIVVVIGTPGTKKNPDNREELHWYYDFVLQGLSGDYPDVFAMNVHSNIVSKENPYGNPYFSEEEFEAMKKKLANKPRIFQRDYKAYFIDIDEGEPYYELWDERFHIRKCRHLFDIEMPVLVGWDWGFRYPAIVFAQYNQQHQRLYIMAEIMGRRIRLDPFASTQAIPMGEGWFPKATYNDYGDGTGIAQKDTGPSSIDELNNVFAERFEKKLYSQKRVVRYLPNTQIQQARARTVISKLLLKRSDGEAGIWIDPSCVLLCDGFAGGYQIDPNKVYKTGASKGEAVPLKDGTYDHLHNALEFIVMNELDVMGHTREKTLQDDGQSKRRGEWYGDD